MTASNSESNPDLYRSTKEYLCHDTVQEKVDLRSSRRRGLKSTLWVARPCTVVVGHQGFGVS
jgi:hypothetical protein